MLKKSLLTLFCFFPLFSIYSYAAPKDEIKVRADYWCPYNCAPQAARPGYMVEILEDAFGKENINYQTMNWARAILDTREGKFDAILGATKEDAPDFLFSAPLGSSRNCFYAKTSSNFKYTGIDSLKDIKLGIVKDYAYFDDLNTYIKQFYADRNKIDENSGDEVQDRIIQKLEADRIGVFVEDPNVASYIMKKHPKITDVSQVGCVQIGSLYIAFPPKNQKSKERVEKLNATIEKLEKSGKLKEILDKYGVQPW